MKKIFLAFLGIVAGYLLFSFFSLETQNFILFPQPSGSIPRSSVYIQFQDEVYPENLSVFLDETEYSLEPQDKYFSPDSIKYNIEHEKSISFSFPEGNFTSFSLQNHTGEKSTFFFLEHYPELSHIQQKLDTKNFSYEVEFKNILPKDLPHPEVFLRFFETDSYKTQFIKLPASVFQKEKKFFVTIPRKTVPFLDESGTFLLSIGTEYFPAVHLGQSPQKNISLSPSLLAKNDIRDKNRSRIEFSSDKALYDNWNMNEEEKKIFEERLQQEIVNNIKISKNPLIDKIIINPFSFTLFPIFESIGEYEIQFLETTLSSGAHILPSSFSISIDSLSYTDISFASSQSLYEKENPPEFILRNRNTKEANLEICKISLETYGAIEHRSANLEKFERNADFFETFRGESSICHTKALSFDSSEKTLSFKDISDDISLGMYAVFLHTQFAREYKSKNSFERIALPLLFGIVNTQVSAKISPTGKVHTFASVNTDTPTSVYFYSAEGVYQTSEFDGNSYQEKMKDIRLFTEKKKIGDLKNGIVSSLLPLKDHPLSSTKYDYNQYRSFLLSVEGENVFGIVSSKWNSDMAKNGSITLSNSLHENSYKSAESAYDRHRSFLRTERSAYFLHEKVSVFGALRENNSGLRFTETPCDLLLLSPEYEVLETQSVSVKTPFFAHTFPEKFFTVPGFYSLELSCETFLGKYSTAHHFSVSEEKPAPFFVKSTLSLNTPETPFVNITKKGDLIEGTLDLQFHIEAEYFAGGKVDAPVFFTLSEQNSTEDTDCFWGCFGEQPSTILLKGNLEMKNGNIFEKRTLPFTSFGTDKTYTLTAYIEGSGHTEIKTAKITVPLLEKWKNISLETKFLPESRFMKTGESQNIDILTNKKNTTLHIIKREFSRIHEKAPEDTRAKLNVLDTKISSHTIENENENFLFTPKEDGKYFFFIDDTNTESLIGEIFVWNETGITDGELPASQGLFMISDKLIYEEGETAKIFVHSPFKESTIFFTQESHDIISVVSEEKNGNAYVFEIPVTKEMYPNQFVSIIAHDKNSPLTKVGYTEIILDHRKKNISPEIIIENTDLEPRDTLEATIHIPEKISSSSQVLFFVVDESAVSFQGDINRNFIEEMYPKLSLSLETILSSLAFDTNLYFARKGIAGGSGEKGGFSSLRENFVMTPCFEVQEYQGKPLSFSCPLPDTIGTFRVYALFASETEFGSNHTLMSVKKPVFLRTDTPLILREGEEIFSNISLHSEDPSLQGMILLQSEEIEISPKEIPIHTEESGVFSFPFSIKLLPNTENKEVSFISHLSHEKYEDSLKTTVKKASPFEHTEFSYTLKSFQKEFSLSLEKPFSVAENSSLDIMVSTNPFRHIKSVVSLDMQKEALDIDTLFFQSLIKILAEKHSSLLGVPSGFSLESLQEFKNDAGAFSLFKNQKYWDAETQAFMSILLKTAEEYGVLQSDEKFLLEYKNFISSLLLRTPSSHETCPYYLFSARQLGISTKEFQCTNESFSQVLQELSHGKVKEYTVKENPLLLYEYMKQEKDFSNIEDILKTEELFFLSPFFKGIVILGALEQISPLGEEIKGTLVCNNKQIPFTLNSKQEFFEARCEYTDTIQITTDANTELFFSVLATFIPEKLEDIHEKSSGLTVSAFVKDENGKTLPYKEASFVRGKPVTVNLLINSAKIYDMYIEIPLISGAKIINTPQGRSSFVSAEKIMVFDRMYSGNTQTYEYSFIPQFSGSFHQFPMKAYSRYEREVQGQTGYSLKAW
jgi:hypothetical protein